MSNTDSQEDFLSSLFFYIYIKRKQKAQIKEQELHLDLEAGQTLALGAALPCPRGALEQVKCPLCTNKKQTPQFGKELPLTQT